jgi:saccharopine dehydrogenase (NAD+, L-lysine-forming)
MAPLPPIHLRAEQKPLEHRSFSPSAIGALVAAGFPVSVERSPTAPEFRRIFADDEYAAAGAALVDTGSWPQAAPGTIIIGLKELPEEDFALTNDHVTFAHCFKNQGGWEKVLGRWARGGAVLYDLEFLVDEKGRRVSAFGYHAGFAGAALGAKAWSWQLAHPVSEPLPALSTFTSGRGYYLDEAELVSQIRDDLASGTKANGGKQPTVMVLGALGRCGRGAADLFVKAGLPEANITLWDIGETKDRFGPYEEIRQHDIFVNAIYLSEPIPPFVNDEMLAKEGRALSVVVDVSCDTSNAHSAYPCPLFSISDHPMPKHP